MTIRPILPLSDPSLRCQARPVNDVSQVQSLQEELQVLRRSASRPLDLSGEAIVAPERTPRTERMPSPDSAGP